MLRNQFFPIKFRNRSEGVKTPSNGEYLGRVSILREFLKSHSHFDFKFNMVFRYCFFTYFGRMKRYKGVSLIDAGHQFIDRFEIDSYT